jgi:hypothetical protein
MLPGERLEAGQQPLVLAERELGPREGAAGLKVQPLQAPGLLA